MDRIESEIHANKAKWEAYNLMRKENRQFALEQAKKRREIAAIVEAELNEQLHMSVKLLKALKQEIYY